MTIRGDLEAMIVSHKVRSNGLTLEDATPLANDILDWLTSPDVMAHLARECGTSNLKREVWLEMVSALHTKCATVAPHPPIGDTFVVEYVTLRPHGPEATRMGMAALPDWARPLYDPGTPVAPLTTKPTPERDAHPLPPHTVRPERRRWSEPL